MEVTDGEERWIVLSQPEGAKLALRREADNIAEVVITGGDRARVKAPELIDALCHAFPALRRYRGLSEDGETVAPASEHAIG